MLSPSAYWVVLFVVVAYSFARGRLDERLAAGICIAGTFGTLVARSVIDSDYQAIELGVFLIDSLVLGGFVAVALLSKRFWPLWVAGFQLVSTFAHALKVVHPGLIPSAYAVAERFWVYPIFLAIIVGTWRSHHRLVAQKLAAKAPRPVG